MHHNLGGGTANLTINLCQTEREVITQLSIRNGISLGAITRRLIRDALRSEDATLAFQFERARRERRALQTGGAITPSQLSLL
jgi:hypothetical protein